MPRFEGFDIIESDSSFHRAKLAQGDQGDRFGSVKNAPSDFPNAAGMERQPGRSAAVDFRSPFAAIMQSN